MQFDRKIAVVYRFRVTHVRPGSWAERVIAPNPKFAAAIEHSICLPNGIDYRKPARVIQIAD
jgi:hypothetical protein